MIKRTVACWLKGHVWVQYRYRAVFGMSTFDRCARCGRRA